MKKNFIFILPIFLMVLIFRAEGQNNPRKATGNELGVYASNLIYNIFDKYNYTPEDQYLLSFRHYFPRFALVLKAGGNISNNNQTVNDSQSNKYLSNNYRVAAGIEHNYMISKRWSFYYELDFVMNKTKYNYTATYSGNDQRKSESLTGGYGISPAMGLAFELGSGISLASETSYDILYTTSTSKQSGYGTSDTHTKSQGIQTQFHFPAMICIRIRI